MSRIVLKVVCGVLLMTMVTRLRSEPVVLDASVILKTPVSVIERIQNHEPVKVIVELGSADIDKEAAVQRASRHLLHDDAAIIALKKQRYQSSKDIVFEAIKSQQLLMLRDYEHLPMFAVQINHPDQLNALARRAEVVAIYEDIELKMHLSQSAPLIQQPGVLTLNQSGAGTTVAVLDSGVDYTRSAFGSCSAPGVPASCKVIYAQDFAPDDGSRDDNGHGSNVAGIVVGIATGTRIASLDVFNGSSASTIDITSAINWAIANRATYNIVALNMSLGSGLYSTSCNAGNNPYKTPIANAKLAGILSVASSGNDASSTGISIPACTPQAVSVGAVYDSNVGGKSYTVCTDSTTAADRVTCFSNSASILSLLAPGAMSTAAGATYAGTSQAAPHVSGAVALLRSAYSAESLDTTISRLTSRGVPVTDTRNGLVKPRIDLLASIGAINNLFSAAVTFTGQTGTVYANNIDATKETGEPNHGGLTGGKSVWWKWTAPYAGPVTFSTAGSAFSTLLGVYTGNSVSQLSAVSPVTSAPNTFTISAVTNVTYRIAVDGNAAAFGTIKLAWKYDDTDGDTVIDALDNCIYIANVTQANFDQDSLGDACDADDDNDGLLDTAEVVAGTNPFDSDSDNDGLLDGQEVNVYYTNPNSSDTDLDGVTDRDEIQIYHINPLVTNKGHLAPRGSPDSALNVADLLVQQRIIQSSVTPTPLELILADMNNDAVLNVGDMLLLQRKVTGLSLP